MTTGGGWQDQIGGALEGARLTRSRPGLSPTDEHDKTPMSHADVSESLPAYSARVATLPPAAAAFLSRHVLCVFTGTCRLAATVARSVVDAWTRRSPGVERALRACAALGAEMTGALDRLGEIAEAESPSAFAGVGSAEARAALKTLGAALDKHRAIQEELWPSIASPTVKALYDCLQTVSLGAHICGAGNGGHVLCVLAPGATAAAAAAAVAACAEAPEARVVRVQMMLGGGGGGGAANAGSRGNQARRAWFRSDQEEGRDGEGSARAAAPRAAGRRRRRRRRRRRLIISIAARRRVQGGPGGGGEAVAGVRGSAGEVRRSAGPVDRASFEVRVTPRRATRARFRAREAHRFNQVVFHPKRAPESSLTRQL